MSVIGSNILAGASGAGGGYQISRSVRLRSSASAYFNRTPASAGNRKTWTWSGWVKLGSLSTTLNLMYAYSADSDSGLCQLSFQSNQLRIQGFSASFLMVSTPVYRDPSAWYHIVYKVDTTQATAADRVRVYVNGVEITAWATNTPPPQNTDTAVNNNVAHNIGRNTRNSNDYLDGYLTEINLIDGQALTPASFGETNPVTGVWQPKKYTGTYGTNGFYLNFSDNSSNTAATIGKDSSGNGNNWTPNNISVTAGVTYDSMLDVPTQWADGGNGRGNYAVMNPLNSLATLSSANLKVTNSAASNQGSKGTILFPTTDLWYCECVVAETTTASKQICFGLGTPSVALNISTAAAGSWGFIASSGSLIVRNGSQSSALAFGVFPAGTVLQLAVDLANSRAWLGINNTWYNGTTGTDGNPSAGTNPTLTSLPSEVYPFVFALYQCSCDFNFGQRPFAYTPPSGFRALNTLNLPTPTILKGNQYFDAVTYAGSASQQTITTSLTGLNLAWIKNRTAARDHVLVDTVRGGSPLLTLYSDLTAAEDNSSPNYNPTSFTTSGIVLGGAKLGINNAGENFVLWGWKEGATQGFDIVTYTGTGSNTTVAHNLGVAPAMMIVKNRSSGATDWAVYHKNLTSAAFYLWLNSTQAQASSAIVWNNTAPTSSVFSVGTGSQTNGNGNSMVAYLFAEVAGFSKFGSYTGNGSADGPFVFCGFRPRFILFKRIDSSTGGEWAIYDSSRNPYNSCNIELYPANSSGDETAGGASMDLLSNGFKVRNSRLGINASGGTYIFAVFSENPFKNALAR